MYNHWMVTERFSKVCDRLARDVTVLGTYVNNPLSTSVTPLIKDAPIDDIEAWWWNNDGYTNRYMQGVLKQTRINPNFIGQMHRATMDRIKNNTSLFDGFYGKFIQGDGMFVDADTQKAQYSEHKAAYASDLMGTSGFQGLKSTIEDGGSLTVMPAVVINPMARMLNSAFCLTVQVETTDGAPVLPRLRQLTPMKA